MSYHTTDSKPLKPLLDGDIDSLFVLPLNLIPFQTKRLLKGRLIKDSRLETAVEMMAGDSDGIGSGCVSVEDLPQMLDWKEGDGHPDYALIQKLAELHSYDVYSLRISLRKAGIPVNDMESLSLSEEKSAELSHYMGRFTRPLIAHLYGDNNKKIDNFDELIALFRSPNIGLVKENLSKMAARLGVSADEMPEILENYGDVFLSLAYYRHCFDTLVPMMDSYLEGMRTLKDNMQMRKDKSIMKNQERAERTISALATRLSSRFDRFDQETEKMFQEISAERFQAFRDHIEQHHSTIGAILCILILKMNAWVERFPRPDDISPQKRAEFLMSEMIPALKKIQEVEKELGGL